MPYVSQIPGYVGRDDRRGNPSRCECRVLLLVALQEAVPEIVGDLRETCKEPMVGLLDLCGGSDPYTRTLLRVLATARRRVESGSPSVHMERAKAQAELYADLLDWATGWRLTDLDGRRNRWLLQHAIDVLRGRKWHQLSTGLGRPVQPAREFRRRQHGPTPEESSLGPMSRDFLWTVRYALTSAHTESFAPGASHALLIRRVESAAARSGFDLPDPLRPPSSDQPFRRTK